MYSVVAYLVLFRLQEMGWRKLSVLLESQDAHKMFTLVSFVYDAAVMAQWVKEGLCKFLDRSYVESTLLAGLDSSRQDAMQWLDKNMAQAFGKMQPLASRTGLNGTAGAHFHKKPVTVAVAPLLTQPKPRTAPEPLRIPQHVTAKPIPSWIEKRSLADIQAELEAKKAENHAKTAAKYNFEATVPRLHETRNTTDALRAEIESQRAAELRFDSFRAQPPPLLPSSGADVKLNTAAILREDAVLQAKAAKEAAVIEAYEGSLRDTSDYYAWQESERRKDEVARLAAVDARKREAVQAAKAAAHAKQQQEMRARRIVKDMKEVGKLVSDHKAIEKAGEVDLRRRIAEQVRAVEYIAPAQARASMIQTRRSAHDAVREQSIALEAQRRLEREAEAAERLEVIRQIRALERVPAVHVKTFDPSRADNHGLLDEMSLIELRERLVLVKKRADEEVEERRRGILRAKREKEELMLARVENIQRMRAQASDINQARRAESIEKKHIDAEAAAQRREDNMLVLAEQLAARRAARNEERRKVEEEAERRKKAALFLGAAAAETETRRLESGLAGMERRVAREQGRQLKERAKELHVQANEAKAAEVRAAEAAATALAADKDKRLATMAASREEQAFRLQDTARRKGMFFEAADREMALYDMRDTLNEYAATMRHNGQDIARHRRGGVPRDIEKAETLTRRVARLPDGHPLHATMSMRATQLAVSKAQLDIIHNTERYE